MRADMAIGAGGTSALERACLGLPCIVIALADNQTGMIAALEDAGAIDFAGRLEQLSQDDLAKRIAAMASDADRRHRLSVAARALVDGRGAARVAAILTGLLQSSRQTV
jgi:spore coat polysaccharide biosynthesis predicted glycosyltransferase SpsG